MHVNIYLLTYCITFSEESQVRKQSRVTEEKHVAQLCDEKSIVRTQSKYAVSTRATQNMTVIAFIINNVFVLQSPLIAALRQHVVVRHAHEYQNGIEYYNRSMMINECYVLYNATTINYYRK